MFAWDDARFFLAVHRNGSLSAASRTLKVNQSTVGRRIASLEEALGVRLFDRTVDGFSLTAPGERFLPHAERIENEVYSTSLEIGGQESHLSGLVTITTPDAFGVRFLTPLLAEFHARYPEIDLEVIPDSRTLSLTKREADMGIRYPRPKAPSLVTRRLANLVSTLYASRDYIERRGRPRIADFAGHDFVGVSDSGFSSFERQWLDQHSRRSRTVFRSNSTMALLHAAIAGMGIALIPCYLADAEKDLVRILPPEQGVVLDLWIVLHKDLRHAARIRAAVDFIVEEADKRAAQLAGTTLTGRPAKKM